MSASNRNARIWSQLTGMRHTDALAVTASAPHLDDFSGNLLVAGPPRSGTSMAMQYLAAMAAMRGTEVRYFGWRGSEFVHPLLVKAQSRAHVEHFHPTYDSFHTLPQTRELYRHLNGLLADCPTDRPVMLVIDDAEFLLNTHPEGEHMKWLRRVMAQSNTCVVLRVERGLPPDWGIPMPRTRLLMGPASAETQQTVLGRVGDDIVMPLNGRMRHGDAEVEFVEVPVPLLTSVEWAASGRVQVSGPRATAVGDELERQCRCAGWDVFSIGDLDGADVRALQSTWDEFRTHRHVLLGTPREARRRLLVRCDNIAPLLVREPVGEDETRAERGARVARENLRSNLRKVLMKSQTPGVLVALVGCEALFGVRSNELVTMASDEPRHLHLWRRQVGRVDTITW